MIGGLGNATYDLEYNKEGFGTMKQFGIQLFGRDTAYAGHVDLYKIPETLTFPSLLEAMDHRDLSGLSTDALVIKTGWNQDLPSARFFIGYDSDVNSRKYKFTMMASQLNRNGVDGLLYMLSYFYQLGIESGTKVYLIAYVCNRDDPGYLDPHAGFMVYPTLVPEKKSNVLMVEIP